MTQNKFTPPEQKCSDSKRKRRIVLVSFADSRYANALKRLERYTERFPFTERHFHTEKNTFTKKYWNNRYGYKYESYTVGSNWIRSFNKKLENVDVDARIQDTSKMNLHYSNYTSDVPKGEK